jgi:hypothetical protein
MKTSHILGTAILIVILLAAVLAVMAFHQPVAAANASTPPIQATVQPGDTDLSEVGSTDGIVIMGFVIVAIISIPLMFRKKKK